MLAKKKIYFKYLKNWEKKIVVPIINNKLE
jgi:hypothetical protein